MEERTGLHKRMTAKSGIGLGEIPHLGSESYYLHTVCAGGIRRYLMLRVPYAK